MDPSNKGLGGGQMGGLGRKWGQRGWWEGGWIEGLFCSNMQTFKLGEHHLTLTPWRPSIFNWMSQLWLNRLVTKMITILWWLIELGWQKNTGFWRADYRILIREYWIDITDWCFRSPWEGPTYSENEQKVSRWPWVKFLKRQKKTWIADFIVS